MMDRGCSPAALDAHRAAFERELPRITRVVAHQVRRGAPERLREELTAEGVGLAWVYWARLAALGKRPERFPTAIAGFAGRHAVAGRRVCGKDRAGEVCGVSSEYRRVEMPLGVDGGRERVGDCALADDQQQPHTDPAHLAADRIDYPAWLASLTPFKRRAAELLAEGRGTFDVARELGCVPGRVSQLRNELHDSWLVFTF